MADLGFNVHMELAEFRRQMAEFQQMMKGFQSNVDNASRSTETMLSRGATLLKSYLGVSAVKDFTMQVINVRSEFQKLEVAFETMLGSEEKARDLMAQMTESAAKTPFDLQSIASGAKQLLAFGESAENVNETIIRLGNIASGLSIPLNDMIYLYGTTMTQGRVFTQDIRQFLGRGIPIVRELAAEMGKTEEEINSMVSAGKIGFEDVQKVIWKMTNEGGQFFNLMEKQSATLAGQMSNLEDAMSTMFNEIGEAMQEPLSDGIALVSLLVENYEKVGKALAVIVATYGAYNAAVMINNSLQAGGMLANIRTFFSLAKSIRSAADAQALFNLVCKANPYVLLASAIIGAVTAVVAFTEGAKSEAEIQRSVNETMQEGKRIADEYANSLTRLISTIQDETKTMAERLAAYKELQAAGYKGTFDQARSMTEEERREFVGKKKDDKTREQYLADIEAQREVVKKAYVSVLDNKLPYFRTKAIEKYDSEAKVFTELMNAYDEYLKTLAEAKKIEEAEKNNPPVETKNKAWYENKLKELKATYEALTDEQIKAGEGKDTAKTIKEYEKALELWSLSAKDATKRQEEYNNALKEYNALLAELRTVGMNEWQSRTASADSTLANTLSNLDELQKKGVKDTAEARMLAEKKHAEEIAKINADRAERIAEIEGKLTEGLASEHGKRISGISQTYDSMLASVREQFKGDEALGSLEQTIGTLRKIETAQAEADARRNQTEKDFEIKRMETEAQFISDKRTELELEEALYNLNVAKLETLLQIAETEKAMNPSNEDKTREVSRLKAEIELAKAQRGKSTEQRSAEKAGATMDALVSGAAQFADALSSADGIAGGIASGMSSALQSFEAIRQVMSKGNANMGDFVSLAFAGMQTAVSEALKIGDALDRNRQKQEEWNRTIRQSAHELAMMQLDKFEYRAKNLFDIGDPYGEMKANVRKMQEAQKMLNEQVGKFAEGRVKTGQREKIDWGSATQTTMSMAGAGAMTGFAVGSIVPVIGNAIGTAVGAGLGAIAGFAMSVFGSAREMEDVFDSVTRTYGKIYNSETYELNEQLVADYDKLDESTKQLVDNWEEIRDKAKEADEAITESIKALAGEVDNDLKDSLVEAFRNDDLYGAIDDFRDKIRQTIENLYVEKLFGAVFDKRFDRLSRELEAEVDNGTYNFEEPIKGVLSGISAEIDAFGSGMTALKQALIDEGFENAFSTAEETATSDGGTLQGAIKSMSEETAGVLAGHFLGLKLTALEINTAVGSLASTAINHTELMQNSLDTMRDIADNTRYCRRLESVEKHLSAINANMAQVASRI